MNAIAAAVEPMREKARSRAADYAFELITKLEAELAANDWDALRVAPYPSGSDGNYFVKLAKYRTVNAVTSWRESSYSSHEPHYVDMNPTGIAKFIADAKDNASAAHDAYVAKLTAKIGEVTSATLEGDHVWSFSLLRVVTVTGEQQTWKTQSIINVSKLGKLFNQFPTRKLKWS